MESSQFSYRAPGPSYESPHEGDPNRPPENGGGVPPEPTSTPRSVPSGPLPSDPVPPATSLPVPGRDVAGGTGSDGNGSDGTLRGVEVGSGGTPPPFSGGRFGSPSWGLS